MDAFILSASKDRAGLANCIDGLRHHCQPKPQRIFIVYQGTDKPELPAYVDVQILLHQENVAYPALKKEELTCQLANRWHALGLTKAAAAKQANRACGWYYQQLLKLMLFRAFPESDDNVLVMDSDATFINPVRIIAEDGTVLEPQGYPFQFSEGELPAAAFDSIPHSHIRFAKRLLPDWHLQHGYSGMVHHMLFQRPIMAEIIAKAERMHSCDFPCAVIQAIDSCNWNAMSEYVLYHHYALMHYPRQRSLQICTVVDLLYDSNAQPPVSLSQPSVTTTEWMKKYVTINWREVEQIGMHGFNDLAARLQSMDYLPAEEKLRLSKTVREHGCFFISLQNSVRFWGVTGVMNPVM